MGIENIKFDEKGLVPVVVQDAKTNRVLMQAYMNRDALEATLKTGKMTYFSRSRNRLWIKGETSGNRQELLALYYDCDGDSLLAKVIQHGTGACHTGSRSCFYNELYNKNQTAGASVLYDIAEVIADRKINPKEGSYTCYLFEKGIDKILKKVGEESAETIIGAKNADPVEIANETADLLYHLLVMLEDRQVGLDEVFAVLEKRKK